MPISHRWITVAIVGYSGPVAHGGRRNPDAHGGVTLLQARRGSNGKIWGRKVNSTGRGRNETGDPFPLEAERLAQWERLGF
jgi:hypothetical protein